MTTLIAPPQLLERLFRQLAAQWRRETQLLSSSSAIATHPAYQRIIGLGPQVIPLILAEMQRESGHWFWALTALTGENPVAPGDQGRLVAMTDAWLKWPRQWVDRVNHIELEAAFPNLVGTGYVITSPATAVYNCIAWAAGEDDRWWWPDPNGAHYWPAGVPREESLAAFLAAYATIGFISTTDTVPQPNVGRHALYALSGIPTHAARQLPNGRWTSKLGQSEDIEHELVDLVGTIYGTVALLLASTES